MYYFYTNWKQQETRDFPMFSGDMEVESSPEIVKKNYV